MNYLWDIKSKEYKFILVEHWIVHTSVIIKLLHSRANPSSWSSLLWLTLHLQEVQGEWGICHVSPLRRTAPAGSWHVCRMSYDRLSARQGSVTQRGQHSPSATAVYSHINTGQTRGQQSTSPSWVRWKKERKKGDTNVTVCVGCCCVWISWSGSYTAHMLICCLISN